jgi:hypothetical protein
MFSAMPRAMTQMGAALRKGWKRLFSNILLSRGRVPDFLMQYDFIASAA